MRKAVDDIPNISISGYREFSVDIASKSLDLRHGRKAVELARKAVLLAREFGGTKNGESFRPYAGIRGLTFEFKTYTEALAFADASETEALVPVESITWSSPWVDPAVFLYPKVRKIPLPR